jgi:hypothetical protein
LSSGLAAKPAPLAPSTVSSSLLTPPIPKQRGQRWHLHNESNWRRLQLALKMLWAWHVFLDDRERSYWLFQSNPIEFNKVP